MSANWFASRLRQLREQARLTQRMLAERVGTTVRTISRLETGAQEATWPMVVALAAVFGVSCESFLQEPEALPEPKRGRPRKVSSSKTTQRRRRGKPGKPE
jgi:transcriptional regulator with XRE-family HTH domain